jgi:hypothetical protein
MLRPKDWTREAASVIAAITGTRPTYHREF